ncbi:restriction endonuclease subunit S [Brachyspira innocens]|uniref:restriction endonuclease subunit S n=1 Tax=Brachyspira innocens TaxID=13264 RepID=UPI0026EF5E85|nr:restriction endonuclease subunit S [Brachyspira innocens]
MVKNEKEWQEEISFNDFCNVGSSKRIYYKEYVDSGIPFYRSKEIIMKSQGKEISECLYISKEKFEEIKSKYGIPQKGDILLTAVGTCGIPYLVNEKDYFYFKDGNLIWLKDIKKDVANNEFILYWLKSSIAKNKIENITIGSVQKALTIDAIKKIKIKLPPLEEQKKIASVLSSLDDKIELNNRMNKILEEMAQTIFKEWFVNFNFPSEDGKPYKDSGGKMIESELGAIPEGWKVYKFENFLTHSTERILNIDAPIYSATNNGICLRDDKFNKNLSKDNSKNKKVLKDYLLFGLSREILNFGLMTDEIGSVSPVYEIFKINKNICIPYIIEKEIRINMRRYMNILKPASREGQSISRDLLLRKSIALPDIKIQNKLMKTINSIETYIKFNQIENQKLDSIRDTLLPKLMSGEIKIK